MRKIGVVIQGPVVSRGFDSTATIRETINSFLAHPEVAKIVISTWVGELLIEEFQKDSRVSILFNVEPQGHDSLNRRRQWESTLAGVRELQRDPTISHVLKVRTDQRLPPITIKFLADFYSTSSVRRLTNDPEWDPHFFHEPMVLSLVNRSIPFHIGDFFFAGQIDDVTAFLQSNLKFGGHVFQKAPEIDAVLKHAFLHDAQFPLSVWQRYRSMVALKSAARSHAVWQYWYRLYRLYFACFPRGVFARVQWRGVPWVDHVNQRLQFHRGQEIVDRYYDFYDEWQLLRERPEAYVQLPLDPMITGRLSRRDWLELAQGVGEWVTGKAQ